MSEKIIEVKVDNGVIRTSINFENENDNYICLTDIAEKFGNIKLIEKWLSIKNTVEFLGICDMPQGNIRLLNLLRLNLNHQVLPRVYPFPNIGNMEI